MVRGRSRRAVTALGPVLMLTLIASACSGGADAKSADAAAATPSSVTAVSSPTGTTGSALSGSTAGASPARSPATGLATSSPPTSQPVPTPASAPSSNTAPTTAVGGGGAERSGAGPSLPPGTGTHHRVTISFAGDVNFAGRTAHRLAADPATAFGAAAPALAAADLTMVNLETAITTGGQPEPKEFTFRAPPSALTALRSAGVDVATMANNHGADYGATGLRDTIAAIAAARFPVIGIGADAAGAAAPYRTTIHGVRLAIFAASAVRDRTLEAWTAGPAGPGIASAFDPALVDRVRAAAASGETVLVYLHWGTEFTSCPDGDQHTLADALAAAGAAAVIGTHAHVLQGAGWRPDGTYVAFGLGNYLWWRSFGNDQDDNGILTLTIDGSEVTAADFAPAHLDETGVPVPAIGAERSRIMTAFDDLRGCAGLSATPPG